MKATDLMIGDWVRFSYPHHETSERVVRVFQVTQIEAQMGYYYVWSEDGRVCHPEQLEPIPITPEILKKNGFGYIEEDEHFTHFYLGGPFFCKDMRIHIGTDKQGHYWLNIFNNSIYGLRSVHELQHALRLCGTETEVLV